ncbi:hypothetical protein V5O48_018893 [Marasmius crinis-equi]|uniref:Uncharacterized protein n=1 Tax=Marasmius crinis-equi TaxID=585013 RepID=A0ABR3EJW0_9AGAR
MGYSALIQHGQAVRVIQSKDFFTGPAYNYPQESLADTGTMLREIRGRPDVEQFKRQLEHGQGILNIRDDQILYILRRGEILWQDWVCSQEDIRELHLKVASLREIREYLKERCKQKNETIRSLEKEVENGAVRIKELEEKLSSVQQILDSVTSDKPGA